MSWYKKEQPTPFDNLEIPGLYFLDGDQLARFFSRNWTKGQKYPLVSFPSGTEFEIWESTKSEIGGIVHVFGEMDLPMRMPMDASYRMALHIAEQCGYGVYKVNENQLRLLGHDEDDHYLLTYEADQIVDIQRLVDGWEMPLHPAHDLMPDEIRANLPPLYNGEDIGLDAIAHVKYFTPDSDWTWYCSEFDGKNLMFGLVSGYAVEFGYFSLEELKELRGPMGLKIERDLHFKPQTLRELQAKHRKD